MRDFDRLYQLTREAGAFERERLPTVEPPRRDSISLSAEDQQVAREKLVLQRTGSAYFKDPNKQKRNVFRSKTKKASLNDTSDWTFSKAERFTELDRQIRQCGQVSLALAVLTANPDDPLDVNQSYASDANGRSVTTGKSNDWLEIVAKRDDVGYVRLLSAFGANQQSKDHAFGKALEQRAFNAAQELLRNNANPNIAGIEHFLQAVRSQDSRLIDLFMTSIVPVHPTYINEALVATVGQNDTDFLALLFAHGASADYTDGQALCVALSGEHIEDAATILYHSNGTLSDRTLYKGVEVACSLGNTSSRHRFLEMLLCAGAPPDTPSLQNQLLDAVRSDHGLFVELLIKHGTSPNRNNAEGLRLAIASGKLELMTTLLQGDISQTSASIALEEAETLEDPEQYEEVASALVEKGVSEASLHQCLAYAVESGSGPTLASLLISRGATLEYSEAKCVRSVLRQNNFGLLGILLQAPCQPAVLSKALPDAMNFQPRSERYQVMSSLLTKGVSGKELHSALQTITSDAKDAIDYQLIDLLIKSNASIDFSDRKGNCLCIAAAQQNEPVVDLLVEGRPSPDTVSAALSFLPVTLAKADATQYEQTVRMVRLLLDNGATGNPVSELLITAVRDDSRGKLFELLLSKAADANYKDGRAVEEALRLPHTNALEKLCQRSKLTQRTFEAQLPNALSPKDFSLQKASMLAHTASAYGYGRVLDRPLLQEVKVNGSRSKVLELLVGLGASADYENGEALRDAVSKGDVNTTGILLSAKPKTPNVARAFPATMKIKDLNTRFALMQALLDKGGPGMGDEALVQASREAEPTDLSHVELLLQHHASPNYKEGASVIAAINAKNLPLVTLFVRTQLNEITLANSFNLTRNLVCSQDERHQLFATLFNSGFQGFATNPALVEVVQRDPTNIETSTLLLDHGASIDAYTGQAMQIAAAAGSLQLLEIFIKKRPHQVSKDAAFQRATYTDFEPDVRKAVYSIVLEAGISRDHVSRALFEATRQESIDNSLLSLLISYGASLDFGEGGAIYNATAKSDAVVLSTLLTGSVSRKDTLNRSFATSMGLKPDVRLNLAKQLLAKEPSVDTAVISHYLGPVVQQGDHDLLRLLMEYKPDPSYNGGESLVIAAQAGDDTSLAMLTSAKTSSEILNRAFESMLDVRAIQSKPKGLQTASIFLPFGIKQRLLNRALLDAFDDPIEQKTKDVVELLIPFKPDFSGASGKVIVDAARSRELDFFRHMASQKPDLNIIIPTLIAHFKTEEAEPPVDTNLDKEADVRRDSAHADTNETSAEEDKPDRRARVEDVDEEAEVVQEEVAVNKEEEENPLQGMTPEEKLVFYLQHLEACAGRGDKSLEHHVIFTAMLAFPDGKLLVKHLLDHGCPANSKIEAGVDPAGELFRYEPTAGAEQLNAAVWALRIAEPKISEEVVLEILVEGREAEFSHETSTTRQSVTTIASAGGRCDVLKRLFELGADPSKLDSYGHSASFYATRNGHKEAVELLHANGAKLNDSSLQEAAREAHHEIVEFLLGKGHRIDFPSGLHADEAAGRTPLEELCLHAAPGENVDDWEKGIYRCIEQLLPKKVDDAKRPDGKTMLHLAFANQNPVPITRVLLDFPFFWENINHQVFLFRNPDGLFYSPTKYVEAYRAAANPETQELLNLLRAKKCVDKFYAHTVLQPDGAIGLPEEIAAAVDKKKRADYAHDEAIKHQTELASRQRAIQAEDYQRKLTRDKERHDLIMRQQREQEEGDKAVAARRHAAARSQAQELAQQRQQAVMEESRMKQQALAEEMSRRNAMQESEQAAELRHKRNLASQEYSDLQSRLQLEQQLAHARDDGARRVAEREYGVLNHRRETAKYEADQRIRAAQAASY